MTMKIKASIRRNLYALPPREQVVHDVLNFDHDDHCTLNNHSDLDDRNQQEFGIDDYVNELNIPKENEPAEDADELDSFSSDKGNKTRVTKTSYDIEGKKLEAIIPWKIISGWLGFGTKWPVMWML
ncbi:hypothetical protein PVK06_027933 [Gossypium arboreum]|uniref:Uncharacterized protein n=1 Tax=Gossypium arboreum TaxID=29729 RepID=A0ABR0P480_GOSAR|nr:hypothetical protein PVK06_027933 [Gossypium arboreum]